jgi:hypothetical protein
MTTKRVKAPRAKTIRLECSEERIKLIVNPLLDFTAYCLSIKYVMEVPSIDTLISNITPAKMELAKMLSSNLNRIVDYNNLSISTCEIVVCGGYFKMSVIETLSDNIEDRHSYNIILGDSIALVRKLMVKFKSDNGKSELSDQEMKHMLKQFMRL